MSIALWTFYIICWYDYIHFLFWLINMIYFINIYILTSSFSFFFWNALFPWFLQYYTIPDFPPTTLIAISKTLSCMGFSSFAYPLSIFVLYPKLCFLILYNISWFFRAHLWFELWSICSRLIKSCLQQLRLLHEFQMILYWIASWASPHMSHWHFKLIIILTLASLFSISGNNAKL